MAPVTFVESSADIEGPGPPLKQISEQCRIALLIYSVTHEGYAHDLELDAFPADPGQRCFANRLLIRRGMGSARSFTLFQQQGIRFVWHSEFLISAASYLKSRIRNLS